VPEARVQLETVLKPAEAAYNIASVMETMGPKGSGARGIRSSAEARSELPASASSIECD
jgi:hypothetical protein